MSNPSYSRLKNSSANFNKMLRNFGVVTVMNAKVFDYSLISDHFNLKTVKCDEILEYLMQNEDKALCELKTLKVANVTQEGPTKTVTGGQYTNALIKFGKTATMEINDALGNVDAIEALCGGVVEHFHNTGDHSAYDTGATDVLHISTNFGGPKTILGDTFFIDQESGQQVKVNIIFYQFLPDSIFNLTQDAEGDASVFDMNGSLGVTDILVGDETFDNGGVVHGVFYSILAPRETAVAGVTLTASVAGTPQIALKQGETPLTIEHYSLDDAAIVEVAPTLVADDIGKVLEVWYEDADHELIKVSAKVTA